MDWSERFVALFPTLAISFVVIVAIYLLSGGLKSFGRRPLERCFQGIRLHERREPGDVTFTYHTYRGCLLWCVPAEHRVVAPAEDAEVLLNRLLRYNLTWGMLSYGAVFVPSLALGNYAVQRRSIHEQARSQRVDPERPTA